MFTNSIVIYNKAVLIFFFFYKLKQHKEIKMKGWRHYFTHGIWESLSKGMGFGHRAE